MSGVGVEGVESGSRQGKMVARVGRSRGEGKIQKSRESSWQFILILS